MDVRAYLAISCVSAKDNVKHTKTNIRYESKVNKRNESEICVSQVWRRSEVRNHKRHSLYTRLSSGTSANTSCRSRNTPGRMIQSDLFWYGNNLKMKPTYREQNLLDYLFGPGGFRSALNFACLSIYIFDTSPELFVCLSIYENAETLSQRSKNQHRC